MLCVVCLFVRCVLLYKGQIARELGVETYVAVWLPHGTGYPEVELSRALLCSPYFPVILVPVSLQINFSLSGALCDIDIDIELFHVVGVSGFGGQSRF